MPPSAVLDAATGADSARPGAPKPEGVHPESSLIERGSRNSRSASSLVAALAGGGSRARAALGAAVGLSLTRAAGCWTATLPSALGLARRPAGRAAGLGGCLADLLHRRLGSLADLLVCLPASLSGAVTGEATERLLGEVADLGGAANHPATLLLIVTVGGPGAPGTALGITLGLAVARATPAGIALLRRVATLRRLGCLPSRLLRVGANLLGDSADGLAGVVDRRPHLLTGLGHRPAGPDGLLGGPADLVQRLGTGPTRPQRRLGGLAHLVDGPRHRPLRTQRRLGGLADVVNGGVHRLKQGLQDLGVVVDGGQGPVQDVVEVLQPDLEHGLGIDALDVELDLAAVDMDAGHQLEKVAQFGPQRQVGVQTLDVQVDLLDLDLGDVHEHVGFGAGLAALQPVAPTTLPGWATTSPAVPAPSRAVGGCAALLLAALLVAFLA